VFLPDGAGKRAGVWGEIFCAGSDSRVAATSVGLSAVWSSRECLCEFQRKMNAANSACSARIDDVKGERVVSPFGPLRMGSAERPADNRVAGFQLLRAGMAMRWGSGELPVVAGDVDVAAYFVFILEEGSGARRVVTGDNPFGTVGWMTLAATSGARVLRETVRGSAFYLVVELSDEVLRELFSEDPRVQILERSSESIAEGGESGGLNYLPLTPAGRLAVESIRRCPLAGPCRGLVLAARCHDLLAEFLEASRSRRRKTAALMSDTETRIRTAAEMLGRNLEQTPSLEILARDVGLSETTLKRGFHRVFGVTVFGHLRTLRMEHARTLLESGEATVIEAATRVGYSNPSNFAAAFRAQFGMNPKEFQLAARR
jgi:AraC-like DNA-binding protein